jgi:hypothetical protein
MERYLRNAFADASSEERFDGELLKTAQTVMEQPAPQTSPVAPEEEARPSQEQLLQETLNNLHKSPVIELFTKDPAPSPEELTPPEAPGPQPQPMAKAAAVLKKLKLQSKQPKIPKVPKLPASKASAKKIVAPSLVARAVAPKVKSKLPLPIKPLKVPSKVDMNAKVAPVKPLKDKETK